jgi:hypothetical protein
MLVRPHFVQGIEDLVFVGPTNVGSVDIVLSQAFTKKLIKM